MYANIHKPMNELRNLTAGELAVSFGRIHCVVVLMSRGGLDPWEGNNHTGGENIWVLAKTNKLHSLSSGLKQNLEPVAFDAHPPLSLPFLDRAKNIIRTF